jgi:hypothetical protein
MDYLLNNLNNSLTLPYDVLKNIHDYADPLRHIRMELISFYKYILEDKMYEKSKNYILYLLYQEPDFGILRIDDYIITFSNINDEIFRNIIINTYKRTSLWKHTNPPSISGLIPEYKTTWYYRNQMIWDLEIKMVMLYELDPTIKKISYKNRSLKQLYKLWLRL